MVEKKELKEEAEFFYGYADSEIRSLEKELTNLKRAPRENRWAFIAGVEDELRRASRFYFAAKELEKAGK